MPCTGNPPVQILDALDDFTHVWWKVYYPIAEKHSGQVVSKINEHYKADVEHLTTGHVNIRLTDSSRGIFLLVSTMHTHGNAWIAAFTNAMHAFTIRKPFYLQSEIHPTDARALCDLLRGW